MTGGGSSLAVECDAERAEVARSRLDKLPNVELVVRDWRDCLPPRAPFEFLFCDAGRLDEGAQAIELLTIGGLLLKDDLTPERSIEGDPVREFLFRHRGPPRRG